MTTFVICALAVWLLIVRAPETPIGGMVRRLLVDLPARRLPLFHRGHIAFLVILVGIGFGMTWLMGGDGLVFLRMAAPEILIWATMFEVTTLLDAGIAVFTAASVVRLRPLVAALAGLLGRRAPRSRRSRVRAERRAANDDDDGERRIAA